ncbi:MAG: hypothetical protein EOO20_01375 [Chryseobacterium sp.]|nr:MAG: hypothetical protein EOO20_01375 [Chryseobacterium sp.]
MSIVTKTARLERLLSLIRRGMVSTSVKTGALMACSDRTIKSDIARLRKSGFDIRYNRGMRKYNLIED